jgi:hypothetical protein
MQRSRALAAGSVLAAAAATLAFAQPSQAAGQAAQPAAAPVAWSATHGDATASGTRWTEKGDLFPALKIEGDLKKTGAGCSSLWVQWQYDLAPNPPQKVATQCGAGSKAVKFGLATYMPTTTGRVTVCKGDADLSDCGAWEGVTSWPIGRRG